MAVGSELDSSLESRLLAIQVGMRRRGVIAGVRRCQGAGCQGAGSRRDGSRRY